MHNVLEKNFNFKLASILQLSRVTAFDKILMLPA